MPEPAATNNMEQDEDRGLANACYRLQNSSDEKFTNRVDSIFGCLDSLEQKHSETVKTFETIKDEANDEEEACSSSNIHCKKESTKRKHQPAGFFANPSKWKKYSLKEDGTSTFTDLSADQLNCKVAKDFMDTLKKQREYKTDSRKIEDDAYIFKVPDLPIRNTTESKTETKSAFGTSHSARARCMETYEFGQNNKNRKSMPRKDFNNTEPDSQKILLNYEHSEASESNEKNGSDVEDEKKITSVSDDVDGTDNQEANSLSQTFISRGKKKNRVIRKRVSSDDDDNE